jgi:hypothetical protein
MFLVVGNAQKGGGAIGMLERKVWVEDFNMVWNVIPSCLMWNILREMDARSFKDCEKTSLELQLCFLKSLFGWIFFNTLLNISTFVDFCTLSSFLIFQIFIFLYTFYVLELRPLRF